MRTIRGTLDEDTHSRGVDGNDTLTGGPSSNTYVDDPDDDNRDDTFADCTTQQIRRHLGRLRPNVREDGGFL